MIFIVAVFCLLYFFLKKRFDGNPGEGRVRGICIYTCMLLHGTESFLRR